MIKTILYKGYKWEFCDETKTVNTNFHPKNPQDWFNINSEAIAIFEKEQREELESVCKEAPPTQRRRM
jgi:hypothetical protein